MFSLTTLFDALIPASIRQMSRRAIAASSCGTHGEGSAILTVFVESKSGVARAVTRALALAFSHRKSIFSEEFDSLWQRWPGSKKKVIKLSLLGSLKQLQIEQPPWAQF